jgi:Mycothiol maleylpyruvate isomerase N-terminal domain
MSQRASDLAAKFEQAVADFATTIEACSGEQWGAVCDAEGWTVAQLAQHVSGQFPLEMEFITAPAEGKPMPKYTLDDINGKNDGRALRNSSVSKADVLKELREGAASTAAYIRKLSDEQLDATGALDLAGGASVSTQQLIEGGVLIEHVTGHLVSIRSVM